MGYGHLIWKWSFILVTWFIFCVSTKTNENLTSISIIRWTARIYPGTLMGSITLFMFYRRNAWELQKKTWCFFGSVWHLNDNIHLGRGLWHSLSLYGRGGLRRIVSCLVYYFSSLWLLKPWCTFYVRFFIFLIPSVFLYILCYWWLTRNHQIKFPNKKNDNHYLRVP
jgi:hypothetical protein